MAEVRENVGQILAASNRYKTERAAKYAETYYQNLGFATVRFGKDVFICEAD